ncbi:hypothetical protein TNCV_654141 [Trichonephila clavipes]|nr:hypothetical protein TNCV_654141 [Trichonephila clavipes]
MTRSSAPYLETTILLVLSAWLVGGEVTSLRQRLMGSWFRLLGLSIANGCGEQKTMTKSPELWCHHCTELDSNLGALNIRRVEESNVKSNKAQISTLAWCRILEKGVPVQVSFSHLTGAQN